MYGVVKILNFQNLKIILLSVTLIEGFYLLQSVPFNLPIPGGMCLKKMVTLRGTVPTTSER